MAKGASILNGLSLNMGALIVSSQKEECQESVAVLVTKGVTRPGLDRRGWRSLDFR